MAKELPYFKFEPNQWENGNIQMLSREEKGLFIDLCAMYWSRVGDVPLKLAVQKLCGGNAIAFNSLCDDKIIEIVDGNIYIKFLEEQLSNFNSISEKNSKIAKDGWEKRRKDKELSERNANASNWQSESDAIRGEKIREDKIKEEEEKKPKVVAIKFIPPTVLEVEEYFSEKGYSKETAKKAHEFYNVADWKDSKGNKVRNWKQKMNSVWFKDEHKAKPEAVSLPFKIKGIL